MDIEALRTFRDVLLCNGITEAGRRTHLSQQAVSKRIASLEKELGCALLRRTSPVTPTPAGRAVMRYADAIVGSYDRMASMAREISHKPAGLVRIRRYGTNTFARIASGVTDALARERQNVELDWVTVDVDDADLLSGGAIDIGFRHVISREGGGAAEFGEGIECVPLRSVEFPLTFVVRDGNPLLQASSPTLADILAYPIEVPSFASHGAVTQALRDCVRRMGLVANITTVYCNSIIGYYPVVSDGAVALSAGGAANGLSPEGMGLDFRQIWPSDAEYVVRSYAIYRKDNGNPSLPCVLDAMRYVDGCQR
jgi:DNA-binding transcriptional LysR family regulator